MEKLNFPGTDWRGLALIGAPKKPWVIFTWASHLNDKLRQKDSVT